MRRELREAEEFERAAREEMKLSSDFALPLCVLSVRLPEGREAALIRRLLDRVRLADLATALPSGEMLVLLPNTTPEDALGVEERLRAAAPGVEIGEASLEPGDSLDTLLERAREGRS